MVAYWIDFGASYSPESMTNFSWRFPIAFQVVFGVILAVGILYLPESPRWLLTRDRHEEGLSILASLAGLPEDHPDVQLQKTLIMDSIRQSGVGVKTPFSALLTGGKTQNFRRMMLGSSSQIMQQLGGCNAAIYYFRKCLVQILLCITNNA